MKWLIPAQWREHVVADVMEERTRLKRGRGWRAWQLLRVGLRLRWTLWSDAMRVEFQSAFRRLRRSPGYTTAAVLMFALGATLSVASYALVHRILFTPLPFVEPDRLVSVFAWVPESGQRYTMISKAVALRLTSDTSLVESAASISINDTYRVPGEPSLTVPLSLASPRIFEVLKLQPLLGRGFHESDVVDGRPVAVITHGTWITTFGGDPHVVGRMLMPPGSSRTPVEIVGVLPRNFVLPAVNWEAGSGGLRLGLEPATQLTGNPRADVTPGLVVRLARGRTVGEVQDRVDALLREDAARSGRTSSYIVQPLQEGLFWKYRPTLQLLTFAALAIWALGCANLSLMVAARAARTEFNSAVSAALGASTARLAAASLAETTLICGAGALIGVIAVWWSGPALAAIVPTALGALVETEITGRVILTGFGLMAVGAAAVGLLPALRVRRVDVLSVLRNGMTQGPRRRPGAIVLAVHSCAGVVLVVGALHAALAIRQLSTMDLGFDREGLHAVFVQLPAGTSTTPDERWTRLRVAIERLRTEPWVKAVSAEHSPLFMGQAVDRGVRVASISAGLRPVLEGYFTTTGGTLFAGRDVEPRDLGGAPVTWISEAVARAAWPDVVPETAIGRTLTIEGEPDRQVVGVFRDRRRSPTNRTEPEVIVAARPQDRNIAVIARVQGRPATTELERLFAPAFGVTPQSGARVRLVAAAGPTDTALKAPRLSALAFAILGVIACVLGVFGLLAVASRTAALSRRELAVRTALGASSWAVGRVLLGAVLRPTLIGLVAGSVALVVGQRLLVSVLPTATATEIGSTSVWWIAVGTLGYLGLACVSTLGTWRQVSRTNTMDVLKGA